MTRQAIQSGFRFLGRIRVSDNNCWEWTGTKSKYGYAVMEINYRQVRCARFSYGFFIKPVPTKLQIDHLCRNRICVNPIHLEAVTARTNILRGIGVSALNILKKHCKSGHQFDESNTYLSTEKGNIRRTCRKCHAMAQKRYLERMVENEKV